MTAHLNAKDESEAPLVKSAEKIRPLVKPLEWHEGIAFIRPTPGFYQVRYLDDVKKWLAFSEALHDDARRFETEAEAKAAAEADYEARVQSAVNFDHIDQLEARALAAEAKLAQAVEALNEAAETIEYWGQYASSYLQEKHDLAGDARRARSAAAMGEKR